MEACQLFQIKCQLLSGLLKFNYWPKKLKIKGIILYWHNDLITSKPYIIYVYIWVCMNYFFLFSILLSLFYMKIMVKDLHSSTATACTHAENYEWIWDLNRVCLCWDKFMASINFLHQIFSIHQHDLQHVGFETIFFFFLSTWLITGYIVLIQTLNIMVHLKDTATEPSVWSTHCIW